MPSAHIYWIHSPIPSRLLLVKFVRQGCNETPFNYLPKFCLLKFATSFLLYYLQTFGTHLCNKDALVQWSCWDFLLHVSPIYKNLLCQLISNRVHKKKSRVPSNSVQGESEWMFFDQSLRLFKSCLCHLLNGHNDIDNPGYRVVMMTKRHTREVCLVKCTALYKCQWLLLKTAIIMSMFNHDWQSLEEILS